MAWYPDWVIALDEVSKGLPHARVSQRNAQDIIRQIEEMQARVKELETERDRVRRDGALAN